MTTNTPWCGIVYRSWVVVFRTGGTENFKWSRTLGLSSRESAEKVAEECRRAGYPAHVEDYRMSMSIGLPETYTYQERSNESECACGGILGHRYACAATEGGR